MNKYLFHFVLFFSFISLYAQENIRLADSVIQVAKNKQSDSLAIQLLHKDFFRYCYSKPEVARLLVEESIHLSKKENNDYLLIRSMLRRGIYFDITGKKDSALIDYDRAHDIATKINDKDAIASVYNNKGLIYWNKEDYDEAMVYYLKSFKIFQEIDKPRGQANSLNNIGLLLTQLARHDEAIRYHKNVLEIQKKIPDSYGIGATYSNLSKNYTLIKKIDSGIIYNRKAIKMKKAINDVRGLGIAYNHFGGDYNLTKVKDSSIFYYKKADSIYALLNDRRLRATNARALAGVYESIGQNAKAKELYELAYQNLGDSEINSKYFILKSLASLYKESSNFKTSTEYFSKAIILKDSISEMSDNLATHEIFEKYQSAEKEKEILTQRANLAEQSLTIQQRNYQIFGLITLAAILTILGYLIFNQQKLKNNQLQRESELKDALAKIETQNRLQDQRLRISRDLHDNIGAQLTFIISSLDNLKYGFELPNALGDKLENISTFTTSTIYELRDTIWAMNKNEITFEDLQSRVSNFVDKANLVSEDIAFSFNAEENTQKALKLSSIEGMNVYRIIQEAVNNALKYAQASKIEVYINTIKNKLAVTIVDNGIGFDLKTVDWGNGLNNMKKRALDIDAQIHIESSPNNGTSIKVEKQINT